MFDIGTATEIMKWHPLTDTFKPKRRVLLGGKDKTTGRWKEVIAQWDRENKEWLVGIHPLSFFNVSFTDRCDLPAPPHVGILR